MSTIFGRLHLCGIINFYFLFDVNYNGDFRFNRPVTEMEITKLKILSCGEFNGKRRGTFQFLRIFIFDFVRAVAI